VSRIAQKYFTVAELAWTYSFAESTIRTWMKQGLFGPPEDFLVVGTDVRIPTSGALFFEEKHKNRLDAAREAANNLKGRTLGEARRKLAEKEAPTDETA
jgi:hypothetical protein